MNRRKFKILIVRLSSLGDILLTTPVLRGLKKEYADSQIDYMVKSEYSDALKNNPLITNLIIYTNENKTELRSIIKAGNYDLIIDLHNILRSRQLLIGSTQKIYRIKKPSFKKWLLVNTKIDYLENFSIVELYASAANIKLDDAGLDLFIGNDVVPRVSPGNKYVGICPGSRHFTKMWPIEYFIELGKKYKEIGYTVLIFGGEEDKLICENICTKIPDSINLQTKNNLLQMASEIKLCKFVVTNDSGLMHAASALNIPVASIFGSTVKQFGFAPYKNKSIIIENTNISCRPCSHIGLSACPKKHFKCMNELTPKCVFDKTQSTFG